MEWGARGRTTLKQRGRSEWRRPVVPRGVLAGAWPPRGVRALARSGRQREQTRGAARRQAGPACPAGPKGRRRPIKVKNVIFLFISSPNSFK